MNKYISLILTTVILMAIGCGNQVEKTKKNLYSGMPAGMVDTGLVILNEIGIQFELPVQVYGYADNANKQWRATSDKGAFRYTIARFDYKDGLAGPEKFVKSRTKQLVGENVEIEQVDMIQLAKLHAKDGYSSSFNVTESTNNQVFAERLYWINAYSMQDSSILLVSADLKKNHYADIVEKDLLNRIFESMKLIPVTKEEDQ